ncbi:hypothetical protein COJ85_31565 [Bacillus sp. AFS076308]|uniref:hypothetical protein n=1 Tax=unclassified Bacillus (in: firmicutes) TaxID=185979 RepID=UPI000BF7FCA3|nr:MULTISPECIES: hypothetical protein [unclassified Bacillus (in: firmicutes)]PFN78142.1 hypothetical protein COJ85_31565 [Bacillus sp. AFS076308]PGV48649.1 hypothetical protein COD92_25365 [Bacillus sp. AFS037270]
MEKKSTSKTRLKVNEQNQLCHQLDLLDIPLSRLLPIGTLYQLQINRSGQNGSISLQLLIPQAPFEKKNTFKLGCVTIKKHEGFIYIHVERVISHKAIKLKNGFYTIQYTQGSELNIIYSIQKNIYEKKYKPRIEQMLIRRRVKESPIKPKNSKNVNASNSVSKSIPISQTSSSKERVTRNNTALRNAKDTSFRRCEHCDYYISRQNRCGLFSRLAQPYNLCSRFHYTKYRTYLGGGFSPR